jgi:hypothetical protein
VRVIHLARIGIPIVYFEKNRVFKAGVLPLNTLAWDNEIGHWFSISDGLKDRCND